LDSLKRPKQWKENGRDDVDWISMGSELEKVAGHCKHDNKPSGYTKCAEFPGKLYNYAGVRW